MTPPWMIEELEKRRREREERAPQPLWIEVPEPLPPARREREQSERAREPIVIELW